MAAIYTRDGVKWRVQWRHAGRQYVRTFVSERHARTWAARLEVLGHEEALSLLAKPELVPPPDLPTVARALDEHITNLTGIEEGTRRRYRALARNHIEPDLGNLPVDLLTYVRAASWVNDLTRRGLSPKTIRNVHSLLSATLTTAVREGHVKENVVKGLRLPQDHGEEMVFLDADEVQRFVSLAPDHWKPLIATLFASGLRFGEATALQVRDVDLARGTLRVRQAWKHTAGQGHRLGPPKSPKAQRTIGIPVAVRAVIARLIEGRGPHEFVFTNTHGGPVRHASFHSHVWTPLVHEFAGDTRHATGLTGRRRWRWDEDGHGKRPRIHDARHTYAALAIAYQGISPKALQAHMGHESIQTTLDTYGHLYPAERDKLAAVVEVDLDLIAIE